MLGITRTQLLLEGHDRVIYIDPNLIFELKNAHADYVRDRNYSLLQSQTHCTKKLKNIKKINWKQQGF